MTLVITLLMTISLFSQIQTEKHLDVLDQRNENYIRTYRIFPTKDSRYFIKLNTQTGQMWQIEFNLRKSNQLEIPLNSKLLIEKEKEVDNRFTLCNTQNSWNFLLLDNINGKIWQIDWDTRPNKSKISALNSSSLIEEEKEIDNRFSLYPTENSWNFLLLDNINGKIWQIEWNTRPEKGKIIPIQ